MPPRCRKNIFRAKIVRTKEGRTILDTMAAAHCKDQGPENNRCEQNEH